MTFCSGVINISLSESVLIGDNVTTFNASDPDGSSDGEVFYEFEGNPPVSFESHSTLYCIHACNAELL